MPPLISQGESQVLQAMSSQSPSLETIERSKSADDLLKFNTMAIAATTADVKIIDTKNTGTHDDSSNNPPPTSMQWVGSYFLDSFNRTNACADTGHSSEDEMVIVRSDDSSVSTVGAHFAESDFLPSNWRDSVEYIPPVGFAVVAGGLCLLNPIVFIGGILTACTALGAVHAAQSSYDICIDGNLCQIFEKEEKKDGGTEGEQVLDPLRSSPDPLKKEVSDVTFNMAGMEDVVSEVDQERMFSEQALFADPEILADMPLPQDPSVLETTEQALEWVNQYYPPLNFQSKIDNLEFSGLNALEFFDVFLADDAPFNFLEFQKKRLDKDIRYGNWEDLSGVTQPSLVQAAATIASPHATDKDESPTYHNHLKERVLHFQAKTNSGLFGPPYATTIKVQRCLVPNKRLLVLESKTTLKDIPFSDRFYVMERWLVTSQKRNDQYVSRMSVSCQVVFSKPCTFEATIISKSQQTVTDIATQWNEMAQTALRATEQARQERLQQDTQTPPPTRMYPKETNTTIPGALKKMESTDSSIEVERTNETSSRILGSSHDDYEDISIGNPEPAGKPPKIPTKATGRSRRRQPSMRKSLSRSLSNIMKRRNSNPL